MKILGISCFYHDSAAAIVVDNEIIAAVQEERFSRIKHTPDFPTNLFQSKWTEISAQVSAGKKSNRKNRGSHVHCIDQANDSHFLPNTPPKFRQNFC